MAGGKKMVLSLIFIFCVFLVQPAPAKVLTAGGGSESSIAVFEVMHATKTFIVVGKISAQSTSPSDLVKLLQKKARQEGGDAILGFHKTQQNIAAGSVVGTSTYSVPVTAPMYTGEGVVIKYQEGGLKEINKDTPVPVLP